MEPLIQRIKKEINPFDPESELRQSISSNGQMFPKAIFRDPDPVSRQKKYNDLFSNAIMGATVGPTDSMGMMTKQLRGLDGEDIGHMTKFIGEVVRTGGKKALDSNLSQNVQRIAEGLGLNPVATNQAISNNFKSLLGIYDQQGLSPQTPIIPQIRPR